MSDSINSNGSEQDQALLLNAVELYETIRVQASRRLSFAPRGDNGLPDNSGAISSALLSETYDGCHQRITFVIQSLVDHSELPDNIHELHSRESSESQLVGTICTALFTWMLSDAIELLTGGEIHTAGQPMKNLKAMLEGASTSPSISLKNRPPLRSLRSTSTQEQPKTAPPARESEPQADTKGASGKNRTAASKTSSSKSRKGRKQPSAKKKKRKSGKRSGKKKGG